MDDIGVALMWIAMSAASVRGLSVFARAAAKSDTDAELAAMSAEVAWGRDGVHSIDSHAYRLHNRP